MNTSGFQKVEAKNPAITSFSFQKNEGNVLAENHESIFEMAKGPAFNFGNIGIYNPSNSLRIQPKLQINQPGDQYEQEADAMADKVMRMPDPSTAKNNLSQPDTSSFCNGETIQRKCADCEKEDEDKKVQRKESNNSSPNSAPPVVHDVLSSPGKPMDNYIRSFMESRFNHDFRNVKIHDNDLAAESAKSLNALAYTSGSNIVFNNDKFSPTTQNGKRLLAHELTHVIQQSVNELQSTRKGSSLNDQNINASPGLEKTSPNVQNFSRINFARTALASEDISKLDFVMLGARSLLYAEWFRKHLATDADYYDNLNAAEYVFVEINARNGTPATPENIQAYKDFLIKSSPRTEFEKSVRMGKYTFVPIFKDGEIVAYKRSSNGYYEIRDLEGTIVWSYEKPLETPLIDPIDLIPFELLGSLAVKTGAIGLRAVTKAGAKILVKDSGKVAVEEAGKVAVKEAGKIGSKELAGAGKVAIEQGATAAKSKAAATVVGEAGKAAVGDAAKAATGNISKTAVEALVQVFRKGEKFRSVGAISLKRLRNVLGRAGVSPSGYKLVKVSADVAKAMEKEVGTEIWGWVSRTGAEVAVDTKGRPIINFTQRALSSLEEAVKTFGHEAKHIKDFAAGLVNSSEAAAEREGEKLWVIVMESLSK